MDIRGDLSQRKDLTLWMPKRVKDRGDLGFNEGGFVTLLSCYGQRGNDLLDFPPLIGVVFFDSKDHRSYMDMMVSDRVGMAME